MFSQLVTQKVTDYHIVIGQETNQLIDNKNWIDIRNRRWIRRKFHQLIHKGLLDRNQNVTPYGKQFLRMCSKLIENLPTRFAVHKQEITDQGIHWEIYVEVDIYRDGNYRHEEIMLSDYQGDNIKQVGIPCAFYQGRTLSVPTIISDQPL